LLTLKDVARILLITNPAHDRATRYLDAWSEKFIDAAKGQQDVRLFELREQETTRANLTHIIETEKPQLVIFNGHGNKKCIGGYKVEILIRCDDNEDLLRDKIVHALACDSGDELGPKCISVGGLAYIGYKEKFKLTHLNKQSNDEKRQDPIAAFFMEPAFKAVLTLIEGQTAAEAYNLSQEMYLQNLRVLMTSNNTDYNTVVASRLYHNYIYQVRLGDPAAQF